MRPVEYSFLLRDMGDAQALAPLATAMKSRGQKVRLLALGQAAYKTLGEDRFLAEDLFAPDTIAGVKTRLGSAPRDFGGGQAHGHAFAASDDAMRLAHHMAAPTVIAGVVSRAQAEIVAAMRSQPSGRHLNRLFGYYDSLALNKNCYLFYATELATSTTPAAGANSVGAHATWATNFDELWVPLSGLIVGIAEATGIDHQRVVAVGSPATDATFALLDRLKKDRSTIRRNKLGATATDEVVFYAGGRDRPGDQSYAESFETFVRALMASSEQDKKKRVTVVGLHPASDGQLEREILSRHEAHAAIRLVRAVNNPVAPQEISTPELTVACDTLATWNSSVASQAALYRPRTFAHNIIFIDGGSEADRFAVVEQGLAVQFRRDRKATEALIKAPERNIHDSHANQYASDGAVNTMLGRLLSPTP